MNTLNPAGNAALDRDAQALLDATYRYDKVAGPRAAEVDALIAQFQANPGGDPELEMAQVQELLGVDSIADVLRHGVELLMAGEAVKRAAREYCKTRALVEAMSNSTNPYL